MKRSKIFLAGTSFLLAIVGIAAAKTHRNSVSTGFYAKGGNCVLASHVGGFTALGKSTDNVVRTTAGTGTPQYTVFSKSTGAPTCASSPLYTAGE